MAKENKLTTILIIGIIAALFLLVGQSYLLTNNSENEDTISVSGRSEMNINPDQAEISLSITTKNENANLAQSENTKITNELKSALQNIGVEDSKIETVRYNLYDRIEYEPLIFNEKQEEKVTYYEAVHVIKVTTSNLDGIGNIISTATQNGANGVEGVSFTLSDTLQKDVKAQALEKAIIAAKDKALSMTNTLNLKLGEVTKINENNYDYTPYTYANYKSVTMDEGIGGNYISPQKVSVASSVNIEFEIIN